SQKVFAVTAGESDSDVGHGFPSFLWLRRFCILGRGDRRCDHGHRDQGRGQEGYPIFRTWTSSLHDEVSLRSSFGHGGMQTLLSDGLWNTPRRIPTWHRM